MSGTDHRFAGYSNAALAQEIHALRGGAGAESFYTAVDALKNIATSLAKTDQTLRQQLASIGVEWDSDASHDFSVVAKDQADYGAGADETMSESASAVDAQGQVFSHARDVLPDPGDLAGDTKTNVIDDLTSLVGHETDHAKQVKKTNESRQQTISALDNYSNQTNDNLGKYQSLPVPPNMELSTKPIVSSNGGTVAAGFTGGQNFAPSGSGPDGFNSNNAFPGNGTNNSTPGMPGSGNPNVPGTGNPLPGKQMGIGPMPNGANGFPQPGGQAPLRPGPMFNNESALGAAIAAGTGGGAAAAAGDAERSPRSPRGAMAGPEAEARAAAAGRNSVSSLSSLPEEEARAARSAERLAPKGRSSGSMMQPATGAARDDEDEEHVRKFAVESDDVFADDRMVIGSVLGEDE
jgi:PPE family protein